MANKFGIPENRLQEIRARDKQCVYCHKKMFFPFDVDNRQDSATIEHLNFDGPFYWREGLKFENVVICCGTCNSNRGVKTLQEWFKSQYCVERNINKSTVSEPVKNYLKRSELN